MNFSRRRSQRLSLMLAAILACPWSVALAAIETALESGPAARPPSPRHSIRPRASVRDDSLAGQSIQVAEADDEDGDGPGRTLLLFTGTLDSRTASSAIVSDPIGSLSLAESPPRLLGSHHLRC